MIAQHNHDDVDTTRNPCLLARGLKDVFQDALLEHIETTSDAEATVYKIIKHLYDLAMANRSALSFENRMMRHASRIKSLSILRQAPYLVSVQLPATNPMAANLPHTMLTRPLYAFSLGQQQSWISQFRQGQESALVRFLLLFLSRLHTLEIIGTLAVLPRTDFFVRSGFLQGLRRLKIRAHSESETPLKTSCYR
jgi:hypothetical protein